LIARAQSSTRVVLRTAPPLPAALMHLLADLRAAVFGDEAWTLETAAPNRLLAELVRRTDEAGAELLDVQVRRPSLEDVFLELTGRSWPAGENRGGAW